MAVYVDKLREWGWELGANCHLIADTNEELHAFAESIGLRREWFQKRGLPHYDLTKSKRLAALQAGAIALEYRQMADKIVKWKRMAAERLKEATDADHRKRIWNELFS